MSCNRCDCPAPCWSCPATGHAAIKTVKAVMIGTAYLFMALTSKTGLRNQGSTESPAGVQQSGDPSASIHYMQMHKEKQRCWKRSAPAFRRSRSTEYDTGLISMMFVCGVEAIPYCDAKSPVGRPREATPTVSHAGFLREFALLSVRVAASRPRRSVAPGALAALPSASGTSAAASGYQSLDELSRLSSFFLHRRLLDGFQVACGDN
jgi:hypothetical protein